MARSPSGLIAERDEVLRLYHELEGSWQPLNGFISEIAPHQPPPPHLQKLTALIERARTEELRACVSMPPRHGKTITFQRAIAWWLKHAPKDVLAYYTYNSDLGEEKSRIARDLSVQVGVPVVNTSLQRWYTSAGGGLMAGGVGTGLTGRGVSGFFMVDDPFKGRAEAESPVMREAVWNWFNDVVFTRLENASCIVVHTRWHEDDLIGRLIEQGWECINLAALAEEGDALGRKDGEALWPARFDVKRLGRIKRQIGEYGFASLYQGRPRPRGAAVFGEAHRYDPLKTDLTGCKAWIGADPAASERTHADYSVAVAMAIRFFKPRKEKGPDGKPVVIQDPPVAYILDVFRRQITVPAFARALRDFQRMHWSAPIAVESVGGFAAVPQLLREQAPGIRLVEIHPIADKFLRAQSFAAAWNDGRVFVPENAPWVEDYINELRRFTGIKDPHDDQVDASAHVWNTAVAGEPGPFRGSVADPSRWR